MKLSPKMIALGLVLVVGVGVSVYLNLGSGEEHDATTDSQTSKFFCAKCATEFEMNNLEARKLVQAGKGMVCPKCGAAETRRANAVASANRKTFAAGDDAAEETKEEAPENDGKPKKRAVKVGG